MLPREDEPPRIAVVPKVVELGLLATTVACGAHSPELVIESLCAPRARPPRRSTPVEHERQPHYHVGEPLPPEHSRLPVRHLDNDWFIQGGAHPRSLTRTADADASSPDGVPVLLLTY